MSCDEPIIQIRDLGKVYHIYDKPADRLKQMIWGTLRRRSYGREFWALKGISLEVHRGEVLGIIGRNGSGKSTLLQCIAGTLAATEGTLAVKGRLAALLELGSGFNPEFSGRENVYLYGAILGISTEEMQRRFAAIEAFADIGDFLDQPMKTYSSGMYARLAFATAIHVDPEILIVDEALSVGDAMFQNKCFHKIEEFRRRGVTILFVSHDLQTVKQICSKVLWIERGEVVAYGDRSVVCDRYHGLLLQENSRNSAAAVKAMQKDDATARGEATRPGGELLVPPMPAGQLRSGTGQAQVLSFFVRDSMGMITTLLDAGGEYSVHVVARVEDAISAVVFGFTLETVRGVPVLGVNSLTAGGSLERSAAGGTYEAVFRLQLPRLQKGQYILSPAVASGTQLQHVTLCWCHGALKVEVRNDGPNLGMIEVDAVGDVVDHSACTVVFGQPERQAV